MYNNRISNLGLAINVILKIYSYIGDTFEINFIEADVFQNQLPTQEIASGENILEPQFGSQYTNVVSLVYRFWFLKLWVTTGLAEIFLKNSNKY